MAKPAEKRTVDMRTIGAWVEPGTRVLDLGCGRGQLLDYLVQTKEVVALGVDFDFAKVSECVRRGVNAYQGDLLDCMKAFPDAHFDRVICSRTLQELQGDPAAVVNEALRVGKSVTVGFVNNAFWKNRVATLLHGRKVRNAITTTAWHESRPSNPLSIADFEDFCAGQGITITRRAHLLGDWHSPCLFAPNLLAGYALYDLKR
jgi:methionine biosynthesis protein MetW